VGQLEASGLTPSDIPDERSFTWVKGELKVQLLRPFHPFPKGAAKGLPVNNILPEIDRHRVAVAFDDTPDILRFWAASAAALVGLKEAAFGRTRPGGEPVDRDFSDAAMPLERLIDEITEELRDPSPMRGRAVRAAQRLLTDEASEAAARELVKTGEQDTQRGAELAVQRAAQAFLRRIGRRVDEGISRCVRDECEHEAVVALGGDGLDRSCADQTPTHLCGEHLVEVTHALYAPVAEPWVVCVGLEDRPAAHDVVGDDQCAWTRELQ
jgi:hypothetical protein